MNANEQDEIHYSLLDNIENAVKCFDYHFCNMNKIVILIDEDFDGYSSASILYNYIKRLEQKYPVEYILHKKPKSHGLNDIETLPFNTKLLIIPDAGTNDSDKCKFFNEQGIDIIILDHHEKEVENNNAIIVNNQISVNYDNKDLAGVGVTYKFLQSLDDFYWVDYAKEFIDMVAFGLIGDMMDVRSVETKHLITKGLSNIKHKLLLAFMERQKYSMNDIISIHNIQWYIVPLVNSLIRVGDYEEKELLFRAFINDFELFSYKPRGNTSFVEEDIYSRAARLCSNAKSRQDNKCKKIIQKLDSIVDKNSLNVLVINTTDIIEDNKSLTGVLAAKMTSRYKRPCVLLSDDARDENVLSGSARTYDNIECFKDIVNNTSSIKMAQGHQGAFGVSVDKQKIKNLELEISQQLSNYVFTQDVDFEIESQCLGISIIQSINKFNNYLGTGISTPLFAVKNIILNKSDMNILGKDGSTLCFFNHHGVEFILFNYVGNDELKKLIDDSGVSTILMNAVCELNLNNYKGIVTPQSNIKDFEIISFNQIDSTEFDLEDVW